MALSPAQIEQETYDPDFKARRVIAVNGFHWERREVSYEDFSDTGALKTLNLYPLPAGACVHAVKIKHSEAFTGGAISAYTLEVGIETNTTKYHAAFDVLQEVGPTVFDIDENFGAESHDAETYITVTARSTGDTLNHAINGVAEIWIWVSRAD